MMDAAVCEWSPGSNRSTVDPVVAVARLDMPEPVRTQLIEKMNRHQYDDVVTIDWASIRSNTGAHDYAAGITSMNFAEGRICRTVTRNKWSVDHAEGAIIYLVGDRAFGLAAVCGNLFELSRVERPVARGLEPDPGRFDVVDGGSPKPLYFAPPSAGPLTEPQFDPTPGYAYRQAFVPPQFYGTPRYLNPIVPSIPEPSTYALMALGVVVVGARLRSRK